MFSMLNEDVKKLLMTLN